jgi:hypothetical protein
MGFIWWFLKIRGRNMFRHLTKLNIRGFLTMEKTRKEERFQK